jgi:hypothetical protein
MAAAEPVRILSADAPKGGLRKNAELFSAETGISHEIELATGPVIKQRVLSGDANADLVVIPRTEFDDLIAADQFKAADVQVIGHVTVGVTIRNGAREPDLSSVDGFVKSVLAADRIIYNTASSGQYVAKMFERLNLLDKIKNKTSIRQPARRRWRRLPPTRPEEPSGSGTSRRFVYTIPLAPISWDRCREKSADRPPTRWASGPNRLSQMPLESSPNSSYQPEGETCSATRESCELIWLHALRLLRVLAV